MKIGFKRGNHWYAPFVRAFTHSEFSHAAALIDGRIYESVALKGNQDHAGVRDYPSTPEIESEYVWVDCKVPDSIALTNYEKVKGHSYDFFSLLSFIPFVRARDSECEYCFELVARLLGIEINGRITAETLLFNLVGGNHAN